MSWVRAIYYIAKYLGKGALKWAYKHPLKVLDAWGRFETVKAFISWIKKHI